MRIVRVQQEKLEVLLNFSSSFVKSLAYHSLLSMYFAQNKSIYSKEYLKSLRCNFLVFRSCMINNLQAKNKTFANTHRSVIKQKINKVGANLSGKPESFWHRIYQVKDFTNKKDKKMLDQVKTELSTSSIAISFAKQI